MRQERSFRERVLTLSEGQPKALAVAVNELSNARGVPLQRTPNRVVDSLLKAVITVSGTDVIL